MENILLLAILLIGNTVVIYGAVKLFVKSISAARQKELEKEKYQLNTWHLESEKNKALYDIEVLISDHYNEAVELYKMFEFTDFVILKYIRRNSMYCHKHASQTDKNNWITINQPPTIN